MIKNKIIEKIEQNRKSIRKFKASKIGLFGSYLKGNEKNWSDIDFLVEFKVVNADNYFGLLRLLEKIFQNKKIDLVIKEDLKPAIKYVVEEAEYVKI